MIFSSHLQSSKKQRLPDLLLLDSGMAVLFNQYRAAGMPISGDILKTLADDMAKEIKTQLEERDPRDQKLIDSYADFKSSVGWLIKFKKRHSISSKKLSGESRNSGPETVEAAHLQIEQKIQNIDGIFFLMFFLLMFFFGNVFFLLAFFVQPWLTFNCDETGLYWRCLPQQSLMDANEDAAGFKKIKDRITLAIWTNADGSFFDCFVIGKAQRPLSFRGANKDSVPLIDNYMSTKKAWMTTSSCNKMIGLFEDLFRRWLPSCPSIPAKDRPYYRSLNYIAYCCLWDNAPSHPPDLVDTPQTPTKRTQHIFIPPNLTCHLQPNDQGIINAFKSAYRRFFLRDFVYKLKARILALTDANQPVPGDLACTVVFTYTLFDAMRFIDQAREYMRYIFSLFLWAGAGRGVK